MRNKEIIYLVILFVASILYTSCLDDGGNAITLASQISIVKKKPGDDRKFLLLKGGEMMYSPEFDKNDDYRIGDCGLADFIIDYSDPANANYEQDSGFLTVKNMKFTKLQKYPLDTALTDTSMILDQEVIVTSIYNKSVILEKNLFLFTEHNFSFKVDSFNLSYNKEKAPELVDDKRIYNLYLRMVMGNDTITKDKEIKYNAINLAEFIEKEGAKELALKKDTFLYFRINYLSAIRSDSTASWKASSEYAVNLNQK